MKKKLALIFIVLLLVFGLFACGKKNDHDGGGDVPIVDPGEKTDEEKLAERLLEDYYANDTYYQIFVRSFADSNNDGIGDLKGITENLDYIKDLGMTGIWLTPIHPSHSYHGYEIGDYYKVSEDLGTMDDLQELIDKAKEKGIAIILDMVFNHTWDENPWFQMGLKDKTSKYASYYFYNSTGGAFETFPYSRDLNLENDDVIADLVLVMDNYLNMGVKGFRMDAIKHYFSKDGGKPVKSTNPVYDTMKLFRHFKKELQKKHEEVYFVGEWWSSNVADFAMLYAGLDSLFNFQFEALIRERKFIGLDKALNSMYRILRETNRNFIDAPFISNHDIEQGRIANHLSLEDQKLATSILLTIPGNPFVYYGQELGMKGSKKNGITMSGYVDKEGNPIQIWDEYIRQPFIWGNSYQTTWLPSDGSNSQTKSVQEQLKDDNSLLIHTKNLANLRKNTPALRYDNKYEVVKFDSSTIAYLRQIEIPSDEDFKGFSQKVLVIHNISTEKITVNLSQYEIVKDLYGTKDIEAKGTYIVEIK